MGIIQAVPGMMEGYIDQMEEDAYADDYVDSSQQPTQSTQQASQASSQDPTYDKHVWGFLQPCREGINRIDLWKISPTVKIGRSSENDVLLANMKISESRRFVPALRQYIDGIFFRQQALLGQLGWQRD